MAWTQVLPATTRLPVDFWLWGRELGNASSANMDVFLRRLFLCGFSSLALDSGTFCLVHDLCSAWPVSVIISGGCACQTVHVARRCRIFYRNAIASGTLFQSTNNKKIRAECARRQSIRICKADRGLPICRHYTPHQQRARFIISIFSNGNSKKKNKNISWLYLVIEQRSWYHLYIESSDRKQLHALLSPNSNVIEN